MGFGGDFGFCELFLKGRGSIMLFIPDIIGNILRGGRLLRC